MHNRLCKFLNDNTYPLQFGFQPKCSASVALIHLSETIKEPLDQGKYVFGIFDYINLLILNLKICQIGLMPRRYHRMSVKLNNV